MLAPPRLDATIRLQRVGRGVLVGTSILVALAVWSYRGDFEGFGADARALYEINPAHLYSDDATPYLWSPTFAQLTAPLRTVPFESFLALIRAIDIGAALILAPLFAWVALLLPPVAAESSSGNLNLILAACVVFGLRWPALWTLPLLTKPSLGVGLLWFAARGEWRRMASAVLPAALISLLSFVINPIAWSEWIAFLAGFNADPGWPFPIPFWIRLPVAALLVVWGARSGRPWAAIIGSIIAMPRLYFMTPAMLLAVLPAANVRFRSAILEGRHGQRDVMRPPTVARRRRAANAPTAVW